MCISGVVPGQDGRILYRFHNDQCPFAGRDCDAFRTLGVLVADPQRVACVQHGILQLVVGAVLAHAFSPALHGEHRKIKELLLRVSTGLTGTNKGDAVMQKKLKSVLNGNNSHSKTYLTTTDLTELFKAADLLVKDLDAAEKLI